MVSRKIKYIFGIIIVLILLVPKIGICGKFELEKDRQEKTQKEITEKERSAIGNTYTIELDPQYGHDSLKVCSEQTCDYYKMIIIKENIDFKILDLVEKFSYGISNGELYKVILDPDGEKVIAYMSLYSFKYQTLYKIIMKSEISEEDRQKLISENEKNKIQEAQKRKEIAQEKELQEKKRLVQSRKEKIAKIKERHPNWDNKTIENISKERVHIGMTKEQAIASWGKPDTINKTTTANIKNEQWCYDESYL
jgi:hypothetical protein